MLIISFLCTLILYHKICKNVRPDPSTDFAEMILNAAFSGSIACCACNTIRKSERPYLVSEILIQKFTNCKYLKIAIL